MHTERVDDLDSQDAHPKVAMSTMLAVFVRTKSPHFLHHIADSYVQFLGLSYVPAIATGFVMPSQVIAQIGMSLDGLEDIAWIPGGWAIGSAVSFAVAGALSDIFGRRWVVMFGQALVLIGAVSIQMSEGMHELTDDRLLPLPQKPSPSSVLAAL